LRATCMVRVLPPETFSPVSTSSDTARSRPPKSMPVAEEAVVLGGEQGVDELPRDLLVAQRVALLLAELADQVAVAGVHAHRRLQLHVAQGLDVRQIGARYR
jgi:hypothetical protein